MALNEFWNNIRRAYHDLEPTRVHWQDTRRVTYKRLDLWATAQCLQGYDSADFSFLSDDEQKALRKAVDKLRSVIAKVPVDTPVPRKQAAIGAQALQQIADIMGLAKYSTPEAFKVAKVIENAMARRRPKWVHSFRCESGHDANGDPAIWIWVIAADDTVLHGHREKLNSLRQELQRVTRDAVGVEYWPYIRFQTQAEQAGLAGSKH